VLIRIAYFVEIVHSPLIAQHRWSQSDMNFFDRWAKAIADGDWLSENIAPPFINGITPSPTNISLPIPTFSPVCGRPPQASWIRSLRRVR